MMPQHVEHLSAGKKAFAQYQTSHCGLSLSLWPQHIAVGMMPLAGLCMQYRRSFTKCSPSELGILKCSTPPPPPRGAMQMGE